MAIVAVFDCVSSAFFLMIAGDCAGVRCFSDSSQDFCKSRYILHRITGQCKEVHFDQLANQAQLETGVVGAIRVIRVSLTRRHENTKLRNCSRSDGAETLCAFV